MSFPSILQAVAYWASETPLQPALIFLDATGYWLLCTPFAELVHLGSASRGAENSPEKQARLQHEADTLRSKWGAFAASDPFGNPNLAWRRTYVALVKR